MPNRWYYFSGWIKEGGEFLRKYSRGPMRMTLPEANEEFLDTFEIFQQAGGNALMHRWDPSLGWQLIKGM